VNKQLKKLNKNEKVKTKNQKLTHDMFLMPFFINLMKLT